MVQCGDAWIANYISVRKDPMSRLISIIVIGIFILWLIPLGVFISPSKEKLLCGGQRAVCLCSGKMTNASVDNTGFGVTVKPAGAFENEQNASGGACHPFTLAHNGVQLSQDKFHPSIEARSFYSDPSLSSLEHVPKV